uniref:Helitron helicase-like domain-containing protein n=1 Tax=Oryza glaberrima TaxID=4538 RepID=I1Q7F0_ORYGL
CLEDAEGVDNDFDEANQVMEDDRYESYRVNVGVVNGIDSDDTHNSVYHKLPKTHHVLKKVPDCKHCQAIRFQFESPGFCCRQGKINVMIPIVPDELIRLFTSQVHNDAKYFRKHIRYFNSHFSFTSLGVTLDQQVSTAAGTGVYTFRVHGALYHRLDNLVPGSQGPRHMQLYFYDTEDADALAHRVQRSPDLDINLVRVILRILAHNPYVQTFNRVGSMPNLDDYKIELNTNVTPDQRRYNAPTASQVAAIWLEGDDPMRTFDRHVLVHAKGDKPCYIKAYHGCYDPLAYPLFNPNGETGWNLKMPYDDPNQIPCDVEMDETFEASTFGDVHTNEESTFNDLPDNEDDNDDSSKSGKGKKDKFVTVREYYCFRLQDVVDVLSSGETSDTAVGKRVVLPRSFPGGDRDMQRRFLNAMALVQRFGRPDYFITMTCNPYWDEITEHLEPGQQPQDRPDLVTRVFRAKLRDMLDLIVKKKYFREVQAYAHVTEFQKRGLPHEHILLIMKSGSKLTTPNEYDKVICAEIPNKAKYPELHRLVIKHMLHGPCGALNRNCACMVDGECRFDFPWQFNQATQQGKDSYPLYRRRDDGWRVKIRGAVLDNRWVVPYNPGLLMRYNCHINVEACASIKSVKYLYKYVYKGHDCASFSVDPSGEINEIQ